MKRLPLPCIFVCATCTYPAKPLKEVCTNPACLANPEANHAHLRAQNAEYDRRKAEEDERAAFKARLRKSGFISAF